MKAWLIRAAVGVALWLSVPIARAQDASAQDTRPQDAPGPAAPPHVTTPEHGEADEISAADIAAALQRYRHEPTVSRVIDAAIAHERTHPQRVQDLASTARLSGWLPTLRLSARRGQTIDLLAAQSTTNDRNSASSGDDLVLEAQLMFDLARVVWSNQELRVERELRAERQARQDLMRSVGALYFERRRLQVERDLSGAGSVENELRIAEIEGLLNGLTGGAFAREIRRPASP